MPNDVPPTSEEIPTEAELKEQTEEAGQLVEGDIQKLLEKVQTLTDERDQLKDQVLRAMADFQNFKRRNQQEANLFRQFATEAFVRDLLPVLDNFERSLSHLQAGASVDTVVEGVRAVERQLRKALESQKVERIDSIGKPFDPALHEALGTDEVADQPEDTVTSEIEAGYKIADRVIRPARVRVSKRPG
ncbi:MAG TPA: nucleotide exchange factor GrpE [Fimbriimonas sp.]|nr:nucleotide exchange factor GrpE [Fimbriimonas sp.]